MGTYPIRIFVSDTKFGQRLFYYGSWLESLTPLSSLDRIPPVPTLQQGPHPLHKYLGFQPSQHIISTSLRDPFDGREMPANGHEFVNAYCLRGVRKVSLLFVVTCGFSCRVLIIRTTGNSPRVAIIRSVLRTRHCGCPLRYSIHAWTTFSKTNDKVD